MKETTASVMSADAEHWKAQYRELVAEFDDAERSVLETRRALGEVLGLIASAIELDTETEAEFSLLRQALDATQATGASPLDRQKIRDLIGRALSGAPSGETDWSMTLDQLRTKVADVPGIQLGETGDLSFDAALSRLIDQLISHLDAQSMRLSQTERFLAEVRGALTGLEGLVGALTQDLDDGRQATKGLQSDVEATVGALEDNVAASDDLMDLKQRVRAGVRTLADRVSAFGQSEAARIDHAEQTNAELRGQLTAMESQVRTLESALAEQRELALKDALTGVHSRGALATRIDEEIARHARAGHSLGYAIWDIDHFKRINDQYGHPAGDAVLHQVAQTLEQYTRTSDFVARLGGEEFVVLLPNTDAADAMTIANKLRELLAASRFEWEGQAIPVTVSCGIAVLGETESAQALYERADRALYQAKHGGRNRCEFAT